MDAPHLVPQMPLLQEQLAARGCLASSLLSSWRLSRFANPPACLFFLFFTHARYPKPAHCIVGASYRHPLALRRLLAAAVLHPGATLTPITIVLTICRHKTTGTSAYRRMR